MVRDNTELLEAQELGIERAQKTEALRTLQVSASFLSEESEDLRLVVLKCFVVGSGKWDYQLAKYALSGYFAEERTRRVMDRLRDLRVLGVDHIHKAKTGEVHLKFTDDFITTIRNKVHEIIQDAPPQMRPFTSPVPDWRSYKHDVLNLPLVKGAARIKRGITLSRMRGVFDAVNKAQRVPYRINPVVLRMLSKKNKETPRGTPWRVQSISRSQEGMLRELVHQDVYFHITMDYRGRLYYRGGLITPQGTDFEKAAFMFKEGMPLGNKGLYAIALQFANSCGKDKESIADRLQWVNKNIPLMQGLIRNDEASWRSVADEEPWQAFAAAHEYLRVSKLVQEGHDVTEIRSHLVCHQDGSCNGLQHGSALLKDSITAMQTNCTRSTLYDKPMDSYLIANQYMVQHTNGAIREVFKAGGRALMKKATMVTGYGASLGTAFNNILDASRVNGMDTAATRLLEANKDALLPVVDSALEAVAGPVRQLTRELKNSLEYKWTAPIEWYTPDGFFVSQHIGERGVQRDEYTDEIISHWEFDQGIKIRKEPFRVSEVNQLNAIGPNFVHSIDAAHCREILRQCKHPLVTVHDSFGSHAGSYFRTKEIIKEAFVTVHEYPWIERLAQTSGIEIKIRAGDFDIKEVLQSTNLFS